MMTVGLIVGRALLAGFILDITRSRIAAVDPLLSTVMRVMGDAGSMVLLLVVALLIDRVILSTSPIRNAPMLVEIGIGSRDVFFF